ncbi:MAG: DUF3037 domain-containing protein [Chloroflexi bacterium]|nr:MAG: DUF3037 domain-containing protein [Chloroflexota bacterium]
MPTPSTYEYAYIRIVPRVEEGEFLNVGVILFCRTQRFLAAHIALDEARLATLAPDVDLDAVRAHLALIPRICAGEGPIGRLGQAEAFHWLVHPHSTVIQTSEVHAGLCIDPATALEQLARQLRRSG